ARFVKGSRSVRRVGARRTARVILGDIMLRSVAAVVAGYATMAVLVMLGGLAMMAAFVPGGVRAMKQMAAGATPMPAPSMRYYTLNIALSLVAAVIGGLITARIAAGNVGGHL